MTADLTRYDDWLAFLTALPRARAGAAGRGRQRVGGHRRLGRAVRPRRRGVVQRRAGASYDAVLALRATRFAIDHVWELPEATWPTGRQCFVNLQPDAGRPRRPTRLLDIVIQEMPERLTMDTRRHGTPMVLHDPDGLLLLEDDDEEEMEPQRRQAVRADGSAPPDAPPGWSSGRSPVATSPRQRPSTCASPSSRWSGCYGSSTARALRLRSALPAYGPACRHGRAGGSSAARAGPGGPVPGSVRLAGRGPAPAHFTKRGVIGGSHHSPWLALIAPRGASRTAKTRAMRRWRSRPG